MKIAQRPGMHIFYPHDGGSSLSLGRPNMETVSTHAPLASPGKTSWMQTKQGLFCLGNNGCLMLASPSFILCSNFSRPSALVIMTYIFWSSFRTSCQRTMSSETQICKLQNQWFRKETMVEHAQRKQKPKLRWIPQTVIKMKIAQVWVLEQDSVLGLTFKIVQMRLN